MIHKKKRKFIPYTSRLQVWCDKEKAKGMTGFHITLGSKFETPCHQAKEILDFINAPSVEITNL